MFKCECGGLLLPIAMEEFPSSIKGDEQLHYERVCDVACQDCGKVYYSQPYDSNKKQLRVVKETKQLNLKND